MLEEVKRYYPPGYEYKSELGGTAALFCMGAFLSVQFCINLRRACDSLYDYEGYERVLREGAIATPFLQLTEGQGLFFVPLFLYLTIMVGYHYAYYHRDTKSIYVMRRLPKCGVTLKSCVQGPLLCMGASLAAIVVLYLLYYGMYLLAVPAECFPRFM